MTGEKNSMEVMKENDIANCKEFEENKPEFSLLGTALNEL